MSKQHNAWTPEQVTVLVELVVKHGPDQMRKITKAHNQRFGVGRKESAVVQKYRNLRETFAIVENKKAFKLIKQNSNLFKRVDKQRAQHERELDSLRAELAELRALLNEQTDPGLQAQGGA